MSFTSYHMASLCDINNYGQQDVARGQTAVCMMHEYRYLWQATICVTCALQAYAALDSKAAEDTAADEPKAAVPEEQWGHKVASLANNGIEESPRKFRAHVRRALILYILLLRDTEDLDALRGVVTTLRTNSFVSYADIGR